MMKRAALRKVQVRQLERKHRKGYKRKPVKPGEFDKWEAEEIWAEPVEYTDMDS